MRKTRIVRSAIALLIISVLVIGTIPTTVPRRAEAQQSQLPREARNWEFINHDSKSTNFSPQTQITKDNVNLLEMKWLYPIPSVATVGGAGLKGFFGALAEGAIAPPLIVDGVVYILTMAQSIYAIDAETGKVIWTFTQNFDNTEAMQKLPIRPASMHSHALYYQDGKLWFNAFGCTIQALDAATGKLAFELKEFCANIPTNTGFYSPGGFGSHPPVIYRKGNVLILSIGAAMEGNWGGRMFVAGYDLTTKQLKWRTFLAPPEGAKFPEDKKAWGDWLVNNCKRGWIEEVPACDVPADILRNDWGDMRFNSGLSNVWGQMPVDEDAGMVYLGTSQPGPDFNKTYAPGPRLFGSSILGLDANTGEIKWFYQSTAGDLWDMDCSWNTILGNIGTKKVVFKGCKNGRVHALDAATGAPIWVNELPSTAFSKYYCNAKCDNFRPAGGLGLLIGEGGIGPRPFLDPRVKEDMQKPWQNYPSKEAFWQNPQGSGSIESDIAFDGKTVYVTNKNDPAWYQINPRGVEGRTDRFSGAAGAGPGPGQVGEPWVFTPPKPYTAKENTTVTALDAATGKIKWKFFVEGVPQRGGVIVSGGVVYFNGFDGNLYGLDAETGKPLFTRYFGTGLDVMPTMGATASGKMRVFQLFGGRSLAGQSIPGRPSIPGALVALGLPDKISQPQVVPKEVVKEKEVIKEVPKIVTVETVGPITYAAVGVAVVALVIAGVAMTRRKASAS